MTANRGRLLLKVLALLVAVFTSTSTARAEYKGEYPYRVTATVGMVADLVRHVGGDKAEVNTLIGSGVDPHLYSPTRNDVAEMMKADVIFYSGLLLEGRMSDVFVKMSRSRPVYAVTELIDESYLLDAGGGHHDPHVWMDVAGWIKGCEATAVSLCEFDPPNAAYYKENAAKYREELEKLDEYAKKCIATIPKERRVMVTAHDAFRYFGRAYEIEVLGIQGLSTESEAGLQDINRLVSELVRRKIPAVFVETSVSDKNVKALIEGAKAQQHPVAIGGSLFSDAMGADGTYEGTYVGMIDSNVTLITRALGGEAPAAGMNGKLYQKVN